jgi:hypothetical protein
MAHLCRGLEGMTMSSILLIVDPGAPITSRTGAAISRRFRSPGATWRISRRTVADLG